MVSGEVNWLKTPPSARVNPNVSSIGPAYLILRTVPQGQPRNKSEYQRFLRRAPTTIAANPRANRIHTAGSGIGKSSGGGPGGEDG